ncbi:MAG: PPOX class F420-dependent oxidoreductase [Chloroflexota bacterium]|nr:PPOX class F420-dependent oxidoreductase [Chloroflexota bacterium]
MPSEIEGDIAEFLREPRHAIVATNTVDGAPQLSPVWYLYDGARFYISVNQETAKYHNLQRDPNISLCIDSGYPNWECVIASGTATLITAEDPAQPQLRRRILERYYEDEAEVQRHIDRTDDPSKMAIIAVDPQKVIVQGFH